MDKYKTELVKQCCCVGGLNCTHCKVLKKDKSNKIARTRLKAGDKKHYEKFKSKIDM